MQKVEGRDVLCNKMISCYPNKGMPGRSQHLANHHTEIVVPSARKRATKSEVMQTPVTTSSETKKRRKDIDASEDDYLDFLARGCFSFSTVEDPFLQKYYPGVTRKNVEAKMKRRLAVCREEWLRTAKDQMFNVSMDGGTSCTIHTLNSCCVLRGVSVPLQVSRLKNGTAESIVEGVRDKIQELVDCGGVFCGICSDNAANMRRASTDLAALFGGLETS